jgi:dTDP-glucose 4,6-dehydratase
MKLLVTGGAGFIGSHFIRHMMRSGDVKTLINLDKLTYAGHLDNLKDVSGDRRYRFVRGDIAHTPVVDRLMTQVDAVVNFAAETHVDRSIQDASPFLHTNVVGTQVLLESARRAKVKRFLHISTDEVYGSIPRGAARETSVLDPSSPYSASKAAADHLADRRYAMSIRKIESELGWRPKVSFRQGLNELVLWYSAHRAWWEPILNQSKRYKQYYSRQYTRSAK